MPAKTNAATRRRQLMKEKNLHKVEVYVPERMKKQLKDTEPALREGSAICVFPPHTLTQEMMTSKGSNFMTDVSPWTAKALFEELSSSDLFDQDAISLKLVEGMNPSIEITYTDLDRTAIMAVHGEQILVSLLICPIADVADQTALNEQLLKAHKYLPLSTIGITTINGQDYYELFGALSSRSLLTSVATEIAALAENYEEVVSAFVEVANAA
ncbi:DUF2170 family protein [Kordiimonas sp. SCSIO 12603]|uniref:DUF2170 family protein n=1 Tax=Kordiimonas sp. SCSIO 12603 TaxID=2829596 RepID=UPI0021039245|nr:DUF2170 family protein [Kordiimonas sp. SCSIO 12603]UTW59631.1 DUF2170 family protein [Kordiimonas sp. SCSIO 12603]